VTEAEFHQQCAAFSERMNEINATRDDSLASLERELQFVSSALEFLITSRDAAPAHMRAQVTAEIQHLGNVVGMISQAIFYRQNAEAEALLIAQGAGQITIQ
jgi:hypothetical protein